MAATNQREHDLWSRLLAGEITEVFAFGGGTSFYLPKQTLGLEPIISQAYRYNPDNTLRSREDLGQAARDLAGGKRWIAAGPQPEWAVPFMEQARAIVFYDTLWSRAMRPSPRGPGGNPIPPLTRYAWYLLAQARTRGPQLPGVYQALPEPPWSGWEGDDISTLEKLALGRFPDKLVHLTSDEHIRQLDQARVVASTD